MNPDPGARPLLGVDIGTSVVKAVAFSTDGTPRAVHSTRATVVHGAGGAVEQDLDTVVTAVADVVRAVRAEVPEPPALVALTGQGDGCWLTGPDHRPVRPGLSWLDGRAAGVLDRWDRDGITGAVYRANGTRMFPGALAPLLAWLDRHEPATLDAATTAGCCKDAVFARLTGERATDPSESSLPFGDGTGHSYSDTVLGLTGLTGRRDLLAPIQSPVPRAPLAAPGAALLGLPAGTPVSAGPYDFPASGLGAGVRDPGDALLILGTTLGCLVHVDRLETGGEPAGFHIATGTPGRWLRAMPAMAGTASLEWLLRTLGLGTEDVDPALTRSRPGAGGVEVLPYLATAGERAPFVDSRAAGQITGARVTTTRDDLVRAVCEGLAYAARHCFETAGLDGRLRVCGGGTGSLPWLRTIADVLGRPLEVAPATEVGARGAVLAAAAVGGVPLDAATWTAPTGTVEPDPAHRARYEDGYHRYLSHLTAARPLWRTPPGEPPPPGVPAPRAPEPDTAPDQRHDEP